MSASGQASEPGPRPFAAVLICDKPPGATSHDVVAGVRRERGVKAGHAGTLDPFATGVLLVLLGGATRLQRYLVGLPKTYRAMARLGWRSSTGDPEGELVETGRVPDRPELPTGRVRQRVPLTSAVRVEGERLYRRAHRGESAETPVREVEVYRAVPLEAGSDRAAFEIECAAGTYVRSLIETLEDAYCEELRRTAIGPFRVEDAGGEPIPAAAALDFMPARELDGAEAGRVGHGAAVPAQGRGAEGEPVRLLDGDELVAVGRRRGELIQPEVVLSAR